MSNLDNSTWSPRKASLIAGTALRVAAEATRLAQSGAALDALYESFRSKP